MAGFIVVKKRKGLSLQLGKQISAKIRFNTHPKPVAEVGDYIVHERAQDKNKQQNDTSNRNPAPVACWQQVVNHTVHGNRKRKLQQSNENRTAEVQNKQPFIRFII